MSEYKQKANLEDIFEELEMMECLISSIKGLLKTLRMSIVSNLFGVILNFVMVIWVATMTIFFDYPFLLGYILFLNHSWWVYKLFGFFRADISAFKYHRHKLKTFKHIITCLKDSIADDSH